LGAALVVFSVMCGGRRGTGALHYIAGSHREAVVNEASEATPRGCGGPTCRDTDDRVRRRGMTWGSGTGVRCGGIIYLALSQTPVFEFLELS
jgi:hypothetical protein